MLHVSMELGPEGVSLLERCPHFRGSYQWSWDLKIREVSSLQILSTFPGRSGR